MKTFDLYMDTKYTNWYRQYYTVEAETLEEAIELITSNQVECYYEEDLCCEELISPEENCHASTKEIYNDKDNKILWDNVNKYDIPGN